MSKWTRYPSNAGVHPPAHYQYPSDRELEEAVDAFRWAHPKVTSAYIAVDRGVNLTMELQVEIADGVVGMQWDTGRSKFTAGIAQADRLQQLLEARGVRIYRRRPWH